MEHGFMAYLACLVRKGKARGFLEDSLQRRCVHLYRIAPFASVGQMAFRSKSVDRIA